MIWNKILLILLLLNNYEVLAQDGVLLKIGDVLIPLNDSTSSTTTTDLTTEDPSLTNDTTMGTTTDSTSSSTICPCLSSTKIYYPYYTPSQSSNSYETNSTSESPTTEISAPTNTYSTSAPSTTPESLTSYPISTHSFRSTTIFCPCPTSSEPTPNFGS
ncbi:hypothetical protein ACQ4LE_010687 [Meloidogyne hapla]